MMFFKYEARNVAQGFEKQTKEFFKVLIQESDVTEHCFRTGHGGCCGIGIERR